MKRNNNRTKRIKGILSFVGTGIGTCLLVSACTESYTPKPRGYFRIEPEQAIYRPLPSSALPYTFEVSAKVKADTLPGRNITNGWLTLHYPEMNATLYCSYLQAGGKVLDDALSDIEDIQEKSYQHPQNQVYGSLYLLKGDCASPIQFVLTDSVSRFFRGALYYNFTPKADSIAPVTDYLRKDIIHLIETFHWR